MLSKKMTRYLLVSYIGEEEMDKISSGGKGDLFLDLKGVNF